MARTTGFGSNRYPGPARKWNMCAPGFTPVDITTLTGKPQVLLNAQECERSPIALLAFLIITIMLGVIVVFIQGAIDSKEGLTRKARIIEGFKRYSVIAYTLCFIVVQVLDIITLTSFMDWRLKPFTFFYYPVFSELLWRITELGYAIYATKKYTNYFRALYIGRSSSNTFIYIAWGLTLFMGTLTAVSWAFLAAYWIIIAHHGTRSITYDNALDLADLGLHDKAKHIGNGYESVMVVWSLIMVGSVVYIWKVRRDCYPPGPTNTMDLDARNKYYQSEPFQLANEVSAFRFPLIIVSILFCLKGLEQIIGTHVGPLEYHHWGPAYTTDTIVSILWRLLVIAIGSSLFLLPLEPPTTNAASYGQNVGDEATETKKDADAEASG